MKLPEATAQLLPLDGDNFGPTVGKYLRPSDNLTGLKLLRDKAVRERDLRELYRGRALYELLQNADDAGATRAVFLLRPEGMAFAHDGSWFTVQNFKSLADGWSDKNADECIGHKGIGFRSVLDITPCPQVIRTSRDGFFGFKFSWALNHNFIQQVIQKDPLCQDSCRLFSTVA